MRIAFTFSLLGTLAACSNVSPTAPAEPVLVHAEHPHIEPVIPIVIVIHTADTTTTIPSLPLVPNACNPSDTLAHALMVGAPGINPPACSHGVEAFPLKS